MRKNIAYIISDINKSLAFEWVSRYLNQGKFKLIFILLNPGASALEDFLKTQGVTTYRVRYRGKKDVLMSFYEVCNILRKEKIDIVHAHLMDASLIGLSAAYLTGVKKRIHTRHNSTFHHLYFPRAIWYDKFVNALSTDIISISEVVSHVLEHMEGADPKKIHLINHGFLFEEFATISTERIERLKLKYDILAQRPVVGVISRFIEWKGIQYIIPAFHRLLEKYPDAILVLANANGPYTRELTECLRLLPEKSYRIIPFEEDVFALYKLFDAFVHVPIDKFVEAFGQTYVEALSMAIPSVFTLSGIANEFVKHKENALVVDYKNVDQIADALEQVFAKPTLARQMAYAGQKEVLEKFKLNHMIGQLENLYDR